MDPGTLRDAGPASGVVDADTRWLPRSAWGTVLAVTMATAAAWAVTIATAPAMDAVMVRRFADPTIADAGAFLAIAGAMMAAMMLPSALPMITTFRGFVRADVGGDAGEARRRTALFVSGYVLIWAFFGAIAMAVFAVTGFAGATGRPVMPVLGAILVGAGSYQFTRSKEVCLHRCRTPVGFLMQRWRSGRGAALALGIRHATWCVGCCWLLMVVLFVAGASSLLLMTVLTVVILAEKGLPRGDLISRLVGIGAFASGVAVLAVAVV